METVASEIEIRQELGGNVKVSITVGRECWVFVWKMSLAEAQAEAEEIVRRQSR